MAEFTAIRLTALGLALQAKIQTGEDLEFLRMGLGDGTWTEPYDVYNMTALVNEVDSIAIAEVKLVGGNSCQVQGIITADDLEESGYYLKEVGLFADDPDLGEILYAATYAGDTADYIPATGAPAYNYVLNMITAIGDVEEVTGAVDPAIVLATKQDMDDHEALQLDPTDTDETIQNHVSNAQAKKWEDHLSRKLPLDDNLILYLPLTDGSGRTAIDASGNDNHGTLEGGASWADSGPIGPWAYCDGVDGRVDCGAGSGTDLENLGSGEFSILIPIKSGATINSYGQLFSKHEDNDNFLHIMSDDTDDALIFNIKVSGVSYNAQPAVDLSVFDESLHFICITRSGTTITFYKNDTLHETVTVSGLPSDISNSGSVSCGALPDGTYPYLGCLGPVRVYKKCLSVLEVKALIFNPAGHGQVKISPRQILPQIVPTGAVIQSVLESMDGFLPCCGGTPVITDYPDLYDAVGDTYDRPDDWRHYDCDDSYTGLFRGGIYGDGLFLVFGEDGTAPEIQKSTDGRNWAAITVSVYLTSLRGGCYGAGMFILVGASGIILTSPDTIHWNQETPAGSYSGGFCGITHGAGLFVAVGTTGEIQTSPDGETWTQRTAAGSYSNTFYDVTYGAGLFVAVGAAGEIQTSTDGETWTQRTAAGSFTGAFRAVTYGDGLFAAVGDDGEIQTSPDGINWTHQTAAGSYSGIFYGAAHGDDMFVAVGASGEIQTSPDGGTWAQRTAAGSYTDTFAACVVKNGLFIIAGNGGEIQARIGAYKDAGDFRLPYIPGPLTSFIKT